MRVLLTNIALETRGGSELYLLDTAVWLRRQGHAPVAYSARLGPMAETIRRHAVPVIDDLDRMSEPPDLIHGHHHLPTMAALARFPDVPAVYVCHGWLPWDEAPPRHPSIRRYVAVSTATEERLVTEHAIPTAVVRRLPNFVDTERFQARGPLPARPVRALIFSNQAEEGGWVMAVRHACALRGIEVELAGWRSGRPLDHPERALGAYDLVFARGRSALEAMAVGCAVVLCDGEGLGTLVTVEGFERLADGNFGMQVLTRPHRPELVGEAIDAYDPTEAARVSALVRATRSLERVLPRMWAVYEEALAQHALHPPDTDHGRAAIRDYLAWLHHEFPVPSLARRQEYVRAYARLEGEIRALAADASHLRGRLAAESEAASALRADVARLASELADERVAREAEVRAAVERQHAAITAAREAAAARETTEAARKSAEAARAAVEVEAEQADRAWAARLSAVTDDHRAAIARVESEARRLIDAALADAGARSDAERQVLSAAHAAALGAAQSEQARLAERLARQQADTDALRARLALIEQGFLYRRVLPLVWRARQLVLPDASRRYHTFRRLRSAVGRLVVRPGRLAMSGPEADPAEAAQAVPPGIALAAIVMDVGGQADTVAAVGSLLAQSPRPEVVVVSSGGGDLDVQLARAGLDATVVQVSTSLLPGATRNVGLAASDAPYVGFLAGDCLARPGWVAGRLAAHAAGADVVSSAVVNHAPWNPFAVAAHTLLFSPRLPGTPPPARLHYGASYARTLFSRFGAFRTDLRAGEDTELRERIAGRARLAYRGDVQAAHRNPTSLAALVRDQFNRGRRTVRTREALYGGSARRLVARTSLTRVPRSVWLTFRATPARQWGQILWGLPWLAPASIAYALGAATSPAPAARPVPPGAATPPSILRARTTARRVRVLCVTAFRNEARFLPDFFANVTPHVDGFLALDDGSTDGSNRIAATHPAVGELIRVAPREPHQWHEIRNRRLLVDAAARHGAEWVLALDADERVERHFRDRLEALLAAAGADGPQAYDLILRELWDEPDRYRADGVWGRKRMARLFRLRPDHDFGSRALHGHWAPENSRGPDGAFVLADLLVYHVRMIAAADRERRMRRYLALDPDRRWQTFGYEYLTDATGLVLERPPIGRDYTPLAPRVPASPHEVSEPVGVATARQ